MNAETKSDAHSKPAAADSGLTKFDPAALKGIGSTAMVSSNGSAFLPASMAEAMELGKLMCLSNFVPPHLRGKPGDCLAVVMQATRWGMDPFAVANKTYFVNDRMAYEAQLVNAVLNSRAPLEGRLRVEWDGDGQQLTCKVTGKIKGDPTEHSVWQEIVSLTTRNSPLWKTSPRQQLAYYTTRMWARLYCPEVLLGVYTDEEAKDMGPLAEQPDGSYAAEVIPPRPTRADGKAATEAARKGAQQMDSAYRATMGESVDEETGEVTDETGDEESGKDDSVFVAAAKSIIANIDKSGSLKAMENLVNVVSAQQIAALPEQYRKQVEEAVETKRKWFAR